MKSSFLTLLLLLSCWCLAQTDGTTQPVLAKAQKTYSAGREAYYDGDYQRAEALLMRSLKFYRKVACHDTLAAFAKTHWKLADTYRHLRDHRPALAQYDSTTAYYRRAGEIDPLLYADIELDRASVYSQMYLPKRAMEAHTRVRQVYADTFGERSREMANLRMNLGTDLTKNGQLREAEEQMLAALDIFQEVSDTNSVDFNRIYANLGVLYRRRGDYDRAASYGKRALTIKLLNYPAEHPSVGKYYNNIGRAYQSQERYDEAIPYIERAVEITKVSLGERHPSTAGAYGELSNVYADAGQYVKAKRLMRRANRIMADAYEPWHPYRVAGIFNAGLLEEDSGNFDAAIEHYRRTIGGLAASPEPVLRQLSRAYRAIGHVAAKQGRFNYALNALDSGLQLLTPQLATALNGGEPEASVLTALRRIEDEPAALDMLDELGHVWLEAGKAAKDVTALRKSLQTIETSVALIEQLRASFPTETARRYLREDTRSVYETGVEAAHRLYAATGEASYLERALELSSAGKSGSLRDVLHEAEIRRLAGVPDSVTERLDLLRERLIAARRVADDGDAVAAISLALSQELAGIRRAFPRYATLQGEDEKLTIAGVQSRLNAGEVLLDYHFGDGVLLITRVAAQQTSGHVIELDSNFFVFVERVIEMQAQSASTEAARDSLVLGLVQLYRHLIAPVDASLGSVHSLIISASDELHHIPFELLVDGSGGSGNIDFRGLDYLLKKFAVSYLPAAQLLGDSQEEVHGLDTELLAFVPSFAASDEAARQGLGRLAFAAEEVRELQHNFDARVLREGAATIEAFKRLGPTARLLHFATHGLVDDVHPLLSGFYLSGESRDASDVAVDHAFVSAADIYGLNLSCEMAVLSACQTAAGKVVAGEGALSLARAFTLAGSRSVVASRWLANDRSTARIVSVFYERLASGETRAQALREAKLAYLADADALTAQPYFWAGLVLSGDSGPLRRHRSGLLGWWWIFGLGLIGVGVMVWGRRSQNVDVTANG